MPCGACVAPSSERLELLISGMQPWCISGRLPARSPWCPPTPACTTSTWSCSARSGRCSSGPCSCCTGCPPGPLACSTWRGRCGARCSPARPRWKVSPAVAALCVFAPDVSLRTQMRAPPPRASRPSPRIVPPALRLIRAFPLPLLVASARSSSSWCPIARAHVLLGARLARPHAVLGARLVRPHVVLGMVDAALDVRPARPRWRSRADLGGRVLVFNCLRRRVVPSRSRRARSAGFGWRALSYISAARRSPHARFVRLPHRASSAVGLGRGWERRKNWVAICLVAKQLCKRR